MGLLAPGAFFSNDNLLFPISTADPVAALNSSPFASP